MAPPSRCQRSPPAVYARRRRRLSFRRCPLARLLCRTIAGRSGNLLGSQTARVIIILRRKANLSRLSVGSWNSCVSTKRFDLDPIRDIQILCPMNRGGLGARSLKFELQKALNPPGQDKIEKFGSTF